MHVLANTKGKTCPNEMNNIALGTNTSDTSRFRNATCHYCHKRGINPGNSRVPLLVSHSIPIKIMHTLFTVSDRLRKADPILVTLIVSTTKLEMEVDTGAALSIMTYHLASISSTTTLKINKAVPNLYWGKS